MKFFRAGALNPRALASAAAALINDDTSGGKPGEQTADGQQPAPDDDTDTGTTDAPPTEPNTDDDGTGDGSSVQPPEVNDTEGGDAAANDQLSQRDLTMHAAGRAEMHERIEAVFASEEVVGRESAAATFLAADLPADKIIAALGKLPKGAAGDAMLARLAKDADAAPKLGSGATAPDDTAAPASAVWDRVQKDLGHIK